MADHECFPLDVAITRGDPTASTTRPILDLVPGDLAVLPSTLDGATTGPTHIGSTRLDASYDDHGHFTAAPTALAGSVRLVAGAQRVVELPAQRRLVPELRRESPAAPRAHGWPTFTARRGDRHQFSLADILRRGAPAQRAGPALPDVPDAHHVYWDSSAAGPAR